MTRTYEKNAGNTVSFSSLFDRPSPEPAYTGNQRLTGRLIVRTGIICKVLPQMKQLKTLHVSMEKWWAARGPDESSRMASLQHIIPDGHTWDRLRNLKLAEIDCSRHELMGLLQRHRNTLRRLCLCCLHLRDTSWIPFITDMRDQLSLDTACICGLAEGTFETGERVGERETWLMSQMNCPRYSDLACAIDEFFGPAGRYRPDMLCPLAPDKSINRVEFQRFKPGGLLYPDDMIPNSERRDPHGRSWLDYR